MQLTRKRLGLIVAGLALLVGAYAWQVKVSPSGSSEAARGPGSGAARPPVSVNVDVVERGPMPARIDAVGTAQAVASVSLKTRVDAQIDKILVEDGALVRSGETLVKLDARQIEAQIRQTEATIAKDNATLDQANRDLARVTDLFSRGSGAQVNVDNANTALATAKATLAADQALLDNQKVQLTWYTLNAPLTGRVGTFTLKAGNIVRSGDNSATGALANIVQISPIYVAFSVPQALLPDLRDAVASGTAETLATPQGSTKAAVGKIAVVDNSIDATTGTVTVRALFTNKDEALWPGQLCNIRVTLRVDPDVVSIPRSATQSGQNGQFVYVVEKNAVRVQPVRVSRFQDGRDIVVEGLNGGETVVTDGALLLINGSRVDVRPTNTKKGAS